MQKWTLFSISLKAAVAGKTLKEYLMQYEGKTSSEADAIIAVLK